VQARIFVLAAGAIENARVLLASGEIGGVIPGNRYEWVGRCFMEHPRDHALTLVPRSPELFREAAFYDAHHAPDGTIIGGRLALRESVIQNARLPNASVTLLPQETTTAGGIPLLTRLLRRCPRLGALGWRGGYGWSRVADPARRFEAFRLIVNLEQHPNPDNRVVLGTGRDALGVPRTELHWRWRAEEQKDLERLRGVIVAALEGGRLGTVKVAAGLGPDPHAHHHAGTTRMHADPRQGVVDPDARVHGTDNLYITGASVFPTAGFANPTLTIVAMALRLADLLKNRL
jgi:choline dehydrogenase-like flavoprotein